MSIRRILVTDPGHIRAKAPRVDVLHRPADEVTDFDAALRELAQDMLDTMAAQDLCVGLAAPQIGVSKRVIVIALQKGNSEGAPDALVLINPVLVRNTGSKDRKRESCMSVPGWTGEVIRREKALVRYSDLDGGTHEREFGGFQARIVTHELDHLEGVLYTDRAGEAGSAIVPTDLFRESNFEEVQKEATEVS